jgi:hypothetical protein
MGWMTASKRSELIDTWIDGLWRHLQAQTPQRTDTEHVPLDAFTAALDAWGWIPEGDRKLFAVATCLYKLAFFRDELPEVEQRPTSDAGRFDVVNAMTGKLLSEDLEGTGLRELVEFPRGRWLTELHVSTVLRLRRVGYTNVEIAKLLPSVKHPTAADAHRDAKAIGALVRKYRSQPRRDLGYTPANWPLRVSTPDRAG